MNRDSIRIAMGMAAVLAALSAGCGTETGTLQVAISGEEAAETGYPADDGAIAFVDGWETDVHAVVVSIGTFELHGADGEQASIDVDPVIVDLHQGEQTLFELPAIGARRWEDVRYTTTPATAASVDVGTVDAAIRQRMIDNGWSMYISATFTKGAETRTIEWGFDNDILNEDCIGGDGTEGVVVAAGAITEAQITYHLDHLFFDTLRLDDAVMRFDAMAAVAGADGAITFDELDTQRLADLRDAEGEPLTDEMGEPLVYDPGSFALPEPTLLYMMLAASTTMGHWNGEGHCEYVVR
ncbi:MAG: hypothetical protein AB7S26_07350 [Sandaracinaceae bacterium]